MPAKKNAKKATAKKATAKKATAKKATAKKATAKKATAKKVRETRPSGRASTPVERTTGTVRARQGDLIILDSAQVGSPAREGTVVKVTRSAAGVSYRVKWADGHETYITPAGGSVTIVRT